MIWSRGWFCAGGVRVLPDRTTVVIPTFAREDMLAEAVRSLELQTRPPDEVIIVDDESPACPKVETSLNVRIVRQMNSGASEARNRGVAEATGDIVFFLDDDDLFSPDRLEHAVAAHRASDIVCCGQRSFDDSDAASVLSNLRPSSMSVGASMGEAVDPSSLLSGTTPHFGATSIRRARFVPLNPRYRAAEDIEWWIRVAEEGLSLRFLRFSDLLVRTHSGGRHRNGTVERIEASRRLLEDQSSFFQRHRSAAAFRLARMSLMSSDVSLRRDAVVYAARSLTTCPSLPGARALATAVVGRRTATRLADLAQLPRRPASRNP